MPGSGEEEGEAQGRSCFLCGEKLTDIKRLKFHLVLKHPKSHTCLFCIERKGWSSEFPSQVAYNLHYQESHGGVIEARAEEREGRRKEEKVRQAGRRQARSGQGQVVHQRLREQRACDHCPHLPIFQSGYERDRHLVTDHHYDVCRVCRLVGPGMEMMVHVAVKHPAQLCHLCGSQSPFFTSRARVLGHMENNHGQPGYTCPNCDNQLFTSLKLWLEHLQSVHSCSGENLRPLKRRRAVKGSEQDLSCEIATISGLQNDAHIDCHILGVLHLLAQTNLPRLIGHPENVTHISCLQQFFSQYALGSSFFPHHILRNPATFGREMFPDLPGDLISLFLGSCPEASAYKTVIEWRFECPACRRFVKTRLEDFILQIKANEPGSFEQHLNTFLTTKKCSCGQLCKSEKNVKTAGDYIFVELDRSKKSQETPGGGREFEMTLFPLKLLRKYELIGSTYTVFATMNLNLDYAEGGHYTVNLLLGSDEVMRIHEDSVERRTSGPTFDSTTVVVALRKEEEEEGGSSGALYDLNKSDASREESLIACRPGNESKHEPKREEEETHALEECSETAIHTTTADCDSVKTENMMLLGDNMRIYLNDDEAIVNRYRREYKEQVEEKQNSVSETMQDVSLKSLGGQVLQSKVYRLHSLGGSRKRRKKLAGFKSGRIDQEGGGGDNELLLIVPEEMGELR